MRSWVALFLGGLLLVGSLFPQTDVEEVYKIPRLFTHYLEHKAQAPAGFGIWDFLVMHYGPGSSHAKTTHQGVSIPMYNHLSLGFVFLITILSLVAVIQQPTLLTATRRIYLNTYSYLFSLSLYQPPQAA